MKRFSMAFVAAVALLVAVGCEESDDVRKENDNIYISINEIYCYSEAATFDVEVIVKDAEWYYVKDDNFSWINVAHTDAGLQISVLPIPQDNNGKKKSRIGLVEIKVFDAVLVSTIPIVVKQYADEDIPEDGPIHFYDSVFKKLLLDKYDTDKNGNLSPREALAITHLDCSNLGVVSLSGIEYFYNLISLDCSGNYLESLDVSSNLKLEKLYCFDNSLSELILLDESKIINDLRMDDGVKVVYKNKKYVVFGDTGCKDELLLVDRFGYIGSSYAGSVTYEMYTNMDSWQIVTDYSQCFDPTVDWVTIWPSAGCHDGRFTVTFEPNKEQGETRYADINIISNDKIIKVIKVKQDAAEQILLDIITSQQNISFSANETTKRLIAVNANVFWQVKVPDDAAKWVSVTNVTNNKFNVAVKRNTDGKDRNTRLYIYQTSNFNNCIPINVYQYAQ